MQEKENKKKGPGIIPFMLILLAIGLLTPGYIEYMKQSSRFQRSHTYAEYMFDYYGGLGVGAFLFFISFLLVLTAIVMIFFANRANSSGRVVTTEESKADELAKMKKLMDQGVITPEEFEEQKRKLLM